jgi:hypothetical protein
MNFKVELMTVLQKLGLVDKAKTNALTNADWQSIVNSYRQEYNANLRDEMDVDDDEGDGEGAGNPPPAESALTQEELNNVQTILTQALNQAGGNASGNGSGEGGDNGAGQEGNGSGNQSQATAASLSRLAKSVGDLVTRMSSSAAPDRPVHTASGGVLALCGPGTTKTHLFGIEHPMFSMSKRWNRITAAPGYAMTNAMTENDSKDFFAAVGNYASSLQQRFAYLQANGMLDAEKLAAGEFSTNYQGVDDTKVGDQYVIRRQDALIARVLKKRDLTQHFPVRYGIQDRDLVFNAFFDSVSQSWQEGRVFKGGMKIENEMGHVDDAMIKLQFGPMKKLERIYIGYLNKEGSDPIKWTQIEFAVLNSLETAQVEQNKRRMRGIYVKPEQGVPGHYLNASTGILYTLLRYYHENKFLLHDDASYRSYTKADMLSAVKEYVSDVIASCTEDMDLDNHVLYLNAMHKTWWIENIRSEYGKETDFTGPNSYANVVPDTNTHIIWLPYLGQIPFMFLHIPGNLQFLEFLPGEMLALKVKEDMEEVLGWSVWKEGTAAAFVGRKFSTRAALVANKYEFQQIFMNKFCVAVDANATTIDATKGFWQETGANTAATVITDITGAKEGVVYVIECGNTTNASKIAKAGNFDGIEAWTPTAVGDYIMLIKLSTGKFAELERCEGGSRTINAALQPNVPGVR